MAAVAGGNIIRRRLFVGGHSGLGQAQANAGASAAARAAGGGGRQQQQARPSMLLLRRPLSSSSSSSSSAPKPDGAGGPKPPEPAGPQEPAAQASASTSAGGGAGGGGWTAKEMVGLVLFGSLVAGTTGLGVWQSQRYFWKLEQIDQRARTLAQAPAPLPTEEEERLGAPVEPLRPYSLKGKFLHDKELRVGPRSAPKSIHGPAQGLGTGPQGHYILTPFETTDGRVVIVNRGWAPLKASNAPGGLKRPTRRVTLLGVVAEGEKPGTFAPPNDFGKRTLLWVDLPAVARWAAAGGKEASCYVMELASAEGAAVAEGAWPKPRALSDVGEFYVQPITHLVYAATWFSLAGFGAFASRRLLRRPR